MCVIQCRGVLWALVVLLLVIAINMANTRMVQRQALTHITAMRARGMRGDPRQASSVPPADIDWSTTALFMTDVWQSSVGMVREYERRLNALAGVARQSGGTVFHLCYGCCLEANNTLLHAIADAPCTLPQQVDEPIVLRMGNGMLVRDWPFANAGKDLPTSIAEWVLDPVITDANIFPECGDAPRPAPGIVCQGNRLAAGIEVHDADVVTDDIDWVWTALRIKRIETILYVGIDANERVLLSRPTSILAMLNRGWPPGKMFVLPQYTQSGSSIQGVDGPRWTDVEQALWARALYENFSVRAIWFDTVY